MPVYRVALLILLALPLWAQAPSPAEVDRANHVLNRLAFGPRPGEAERVARMGVGRWIEAQLSSTTNLDSAGRFAQRDCPTWLRTTPPALSSMNMSSSGPTAAAGGTSVSTGSGTMKTFFSFFASMAPPMLRDSARNRAGGEAFLQTGQFFACRLARVEATEQQLVEVMTDFWGNHFSMYYTKVLGAPSYVEWDRDVVRPRSLGRFRDLLGAVAHHPAMLNYLDNAISKADSLNENYGRELLELHTLGVDGGYTQADVIDVSRALTGWSHSGIRGASAPGPGGTLHFVFWPSNHDTKPKTVLGHSLPAGRGIEDGEEVLDILARHPSTATHIAKKLAVRFVSDDPPPALVERAAATFLRTDGDIREVMRTIVTSPEFFASESRRAKVKSPLEFVLSARRALAAPEDTASEIVDLLIHLNQAPLTHLTPDGWPETASEWLGVGAIGSRVRIATRIASDEFPSIPVARWPEWSRLSVAPFDAQVEGVVQSLLGGRVSETTRAAMLRARPGTAENGAAALRELLGLALSSPEFQRR
jgi:uncharacterized protein (DUF1800 family)